MILYLDGHDFRYAIEQCQLVFFPEERPVFVDAIPPHNTGTDSVLSRLSVARRYASAYTILRRRGDVFRGMARADLSGGGDACARERALAWAVKLSFYRAAIRATGFKPPWGATTGIRPAGLLRTLMRGGLTLAQADRVLRDRFDVSREKLDLCRSAAKAALTVERSLSNRDISLYVGIPFCPTRCAYCTFVSHSVSKAGHLLPGFLEALYREIEATGMLVKALRLRAISLYIGGGTPTTLDAGQLDHLTGKLSEAFDLSALREYTVEAGRPDTITREKLSVLRRHGTTRICVNPQTLRADVLAAIGRPHTPDDAVRAFDMAARDGFQINTDLIAGLPGDTPDGFAYSLDRILDLRPDNITIHTLAFKKGSALAQSSAPLPSPASVGAMLAYAYERLSTSGYVCYYLYRQKFMSGPFENTGWTLPGRGNLYNICMMEELRSVFAMGGGGVTKLVDPETGRVQRVFNPKYPYEYLSRIDDIIRSKDKMKTLLN